MCYRIVQYNISLALSRNSIRVPAGSKILCVVDSTEPPNSFKLIVQERVDNSCRELGAPQAQLPQTSDWEIYTRPGSQDYNPYYDKFLGIIGASGTNFRTVFVRGYNG